jgi:hypothetical protein
MQNRICKYLRHPKEAFTIRVGVGVSVERSDPIEIELCSWPRHFADRLPPVVLRHGGAIDDHDCDRCPWPIEIALPAAEAGK